MKHLTIYVSGKVQGVSYRAATKAVADIMGIKGIVKNLPDGRVYIEAEGGDTELEEFLKWCAEGPEKAGVTDVSHTGEALKNYSNFEVIKLASKR